MGGGRGLKWKPLCEGKLEGRFVDAELVARAAEVLADNLGVVLAIKLNVQNVDDAGKDAGVSNARGRVCCSKESAHKTFS